MNHPQRAAIQAEPGLWTPLRCWGDEVAINKERSRTLVIRIRPLESPTSVVSLNVKLRLTHKFEHESTFGTHV
jgi:hypothetical protein